MRAIPQLSHETIIVRCQCHLRVPSHKMIKCVRCGFYSHEKCVNSIRPFICCYCQIANERILTEMFDKNITPSGAILDKKSIFNEIVGNKSLFQVCEIREHCQAADQVINLLRYLISYLGDLNLKLKNAEIQMQREAYAPIREELMREIETKRMAYIKYTKLLAVVFERVSDFRRKEKLLPYFRDSVMQKLV